MSAVTPRWAILLASLIVMGCNGGGGDNSSTSGPKQITPASIAAQTSTSITAVVGTAVNPPPAVRVLSSSGDPVSGVSVTFAVSAGGGNVTGGTVSTGSDGVATVGSWTLGTSAGQQRLTASVAGLTAVDFSATAGPDVPASITPQGTATLNGIVGTAVSTVPAAIVKDRYNNPNAGVAVTFAVTQGGGSVAGASTTTDASGVAHPTSWTLGSAVGTNTLTATVAGIATPATFTATAAAGPPAAMSFVAGSGQSAMVNTSVAVSPAVHVSDSFGNPIGGQSISFTPSIGSVANASAVTGPDGVATPGAWTLGKTAGTNSLKATLGTLSATLTAVGLPGPASALIPVVVPPSTITVAASVTPAPSVRVTDAYANAISGANVTFAVQSGGGTVSGGSASSDANGLAAVGAWTLGTHAGLQTLRASVSGVAPVDFNVNSVAGPPALMGLVAGGNQYSRVNTVLPVPPSVGVIDQYNNPVVGGAVTFTPMGISGSVANTTATTNAQGVATVGSWTLGPAAGVDSIYATIGGLPPLPIYARVVPISQFNITLRFLTPATATQQAAFQRAAERWRDVVIGDLPDVSVTAPANFCGVGEPALNETIDDVLIYVKLDSIDGPGAILGGGAPCATRTSDGLSLLGIMVFDTADVAQLQADNQFTDVVLHEMGHVLGIGSLWQDFALLSGAGTTDPFFTGANGRAGFSLVGGNLYPGNPVPVENTGGAGTADGHWRESVLNTELMTGYISPPGVPNPLSLVTIGSLEDLGYSITPWGYDVFQLGLNLRQGVGTPSRQLRELPPKKPPVAVDDAGKILTESRPLLRAPAGTRIVSRASVAPRQLQFVKRR